MVTEEKMAQILKLPPEKRVEALKELEAELKKLQEDQEKGIEEAAEESKRAQEMIERLKEQTPQNDLNIEEMFKKEQQEQQEELEKKVQDAPVQQTQGLVYDQQTIGQKPAYDLTSQEKMDEIRVLADKSYSGNLSQSEVERVNYLRDQVQGFTNTENVSDEVKEKLQEEGRMLANIENYRTGGT